MVYPITPNILQDAGELFAEIFDILNRVTEHGRYPYRLMRSLTINPLQEAFISANLQLLADSDNQLTIFQRAGRSLWAAGEAALIDVITVPIIAGTIAGGAAIGAPTDGLIPVDEGVGATAGYVIGAASSNAILVNASDPWATPWIYTTFNLYDPNGN